MKAFTDHMAGYAARFWQRLALPPLLAVPPLVWLSLFCLIPLFIILKISFSEAVFGRPPYVDILEYIPPARLFIKLDFESYALLFDDPLYWESFWNSLRLAALSTGLALLLGFPMAYGISRLTHPWKNLALALVIVPFWTSYLIRVYAWYELLGDTGVLNDFLMAFGVIDSPLRLLKTPFAVVIGIVYCYLPFMILPLYAALEKFDWSLIEASYDLGCRPLRSFFTILIPLTLPAIGAGAMLVFIPAMGEFVIPDLLGGERTLMLGKMLWWEFFSNRDWPVAASVAVLLIIFLSIPILIFQRLERRSLERQGDH